MKKKLFVIALAFAMIFALAACGGSGSETESSSEAAADPNAGVAGIVFAVPDGWTPYNITAGSYSSFSNPDSGFVLSASAFGESDLEDYNNWSEDETLDSVQAYYEKYYTTSEEELKENNIEQTTVQICGEDACYNKHSNGAGGYVALSTYWIYDGTLYSFSLFNSDAYDDEGKLKDDAPALTDEEIAMYESIQSGVQPGDGTAFQTEALSELGSSVGEFTYEIPSGYTVQNVMDSFVDTQKDGNSIYLQVSVTSENELQNIEFADGEHPSSLQEYYDMYHDGMEDSVTTIAGYDGYMFEYPDENGNYYNINAEFMTDSAIYNIVMFSDAYDDEGNIKDGAVALSEDDIAVFEAFVASFTKK